MFKHEEIDCDVCLKEESKSKSLKLKKTRILQKEIFPYKECWLCNITFRSEKLQVQHFIDEHECQYCDNLYFENTDLKKAHISEVHKCDFCEEMFYEKAAKHDHIDKKHPSTSSETITRLTKLSSEDEEELELELDSESNTLETVRMDQKTPSSYFLKTILLYKYFRIILPL